MGIRRVYDNLSKWQITPIQHRPSNAFELNIVKSTWHESYGKPAIQLKVAARLSKTLRDIAFGRNDHIVVAQQIIPSIARDLGTALIEAADEAEKRR